MLSNFANYWHYFVQYTTLLALQMQPLVCFSQFLCVLGSGIVVLLTSSCGNSCLHCGSDEAHRTGHLWCSKWAVWLDSMSHGRMPSSHGAVHFWSEFQMFWFIHSSSPKLYDHFCSYSSVQPDFLDSRKKEYHAQPVTQQWTFCDPLTFELTWTLGDLGDLLFSAITVPDFPLFHILWGPCI